MYKPFTTISLDNGFEVDVKRCGCCYIYIRQNYHGFLDNTK